MGLDVGRRFKSRPLLNAELVLLVDHDESQAFEFNIVAHKRIEVAQSKKSIAESQLHSMVELAIAEVVQNGIEEQLHDLADARVLPEGVLLHEQGANRQDDAVEHRHKEEAEHKVQPPEFPFHE